MLNILQTKIAFADWIKENILSRINCSKNCIQRWRKIRSNWHFRLETYVVRNMINKRCAGIYRKMNIWTWHMVLRDINTLRICKDTTWITVIQQKYRLGTLNRFAYIVCWVKVLIWWYSCDIYNINWWSMECVSRDTC